jgi:hypothetical protein
LPKKPLVPSTLHRMSDIGPESTLLGPSASRREWLFLPHTGRSQYSPESAEEGWKTDLTLYRDKGQQWHESALRGRVIDDRTLGRPRHMQ